MFSKGRRGHGGNGDRKCPFQTNLSCISATSETFDRGANANCIHLCQKMVFGVLFEKLVERVD